MATDDFTDLVAMLKSRRVQFLVVNGHGETTSVTGWERQVEALAAEGFHLHIISNFGRLFSPDELRVMSLVRNIQISVDTHNPQMLRKIRRRVDLGNILINMIGVVSAAHAAGRTPPIFSWSCVLTDKVAASFLDYVRFALTLGVRNFDICNLTKYPDVPGAEVVAHVTTLPTDELLKLSNDIHVAQKMVTASGGQIAVQAGLTDAIKEELARRAQ